MATTIDKDRQKRIEKIARELNGHNREIGAGNRSRKDLLSDASFVHMVRHEGVTVETMAMMLTDAFNAVRKLRAAPASAGDGDADGDGGRK